MVNNPISENQEQLISLVYARTSARLESQLQIATANDQRSLVFATISIAAAAVIFGSLKGSNVVFFAQGSAAFLCVSAFFSACAALPQKMFTSGSKSMELREFIDCDSSFNEVLLGLSENNDGYINNNEFAAKLRTDIYKFSVVLFLVGILIALGGFLAFEQMPVGGSK